MYARDEDIKDELYTMIDNGGKVLDIIVEHRSVRPD